MLSQIAAASFYARALMQVPDDVLADVLGIEKYASFSAPFTTLATTLAVTGGVSVGAG